jgi:hypothetical protein
VLSLLRAAQARMTRRRPAHWRVFAGGEAAELRRGAQPELRPLNARALVGDPGAELVSSAPAEGVERVLVAEAPVFVCRC